MMIVISILLIFFGFYSNNKSLIKRERMMAENKKQELERIKRELNEEGFINQFIQIFENKDYQKLSIILCLKQ